MLSNPSPLIFISVNALCRLVAKMSQQWLLPVNLCCTPAVQRTHEGPICSVNRKTEEHFELWYSCFPVVPFVITLGGTAVAGLTAVLIRLLSEESRSLLTTADCALLSGASYLIPIFINTPALPRAAMALRGFVITFLIAPGDESTWIKYKVCSVMQSSAGANTQRGIMNLALIYMKILTMLARKYMWLSGAWKGEEIISG